MYNSILHNPIYMAPEKVGKLHWSHLRVHSFLFSLRVIIMVWKIKLPDTDANIFLLIKLQSSPRIVEEWHIKNSKSSNFLHCRSLIWKAAWIPKAVASGTPSVKNHRYLTIKGLALKRILCFFFFFFKIQMKSTWFAVWHQRDQLVFSLVHLIIVSGERYRNISLAYRSSSSSSSPVSRTKKMSVHNFKIRSTLGSSSNMIEWEIPLKNSRTNFPTTRTTDAYSPMMLKSKNGKSSNHTLKKGQSSERELIYTANCSLSAEWTLIYN